MKKRPKGYREIVVDEKTFYWFFKTAKLKVIDAESGKCIFFDWMTEKYCHYTYSDYYGENVFLVTPRVVRDVIKDKINWIPENEIRKNKNRTKR